MKPLNILFILLSFFSLSCNFSHLQAQEREIHLSDSEKNELNQKYREYLKEQSTNAESPIQQLAKEILKRFPQDKLSKALEKIDKQTPQIAKDKEIKSAVNKALMKKLHGSNVYNELDNVLYAHYKSFQKNQKVTSSNPPGWCRAEINDVEIGDYHFNDHLENLQSWVEGNSKPAADDLALNFVPTDNNELTVLSDKEQFWPSLMKDLKEANDHIHINIFGFMGDSWGREVTDLLAEKVKQGVKVRILADALGARMHLYFQYKNKDFIKELQDKGIEVILTEDKVSNGKLHFDHRKFYVIDGKIGYNTGYTIEEHMRKIHFDMGMRIKGDMVKQLQSHFLASYFHFGGKLPVDIKFESFMKQYYQEMDEMPESPVSAKILENVPEVQHRATESYFSRVTNAKKKVTIINEFLSEPTFFEVVKKAADRGVEVEVIYPRVSEWAIHRMAAENFFQQFKDNPKVKIYLYDGPENNGWLHTKGIVIDDNYINFGSTNMDSLALFHNFEMNIETSDPKVVADVKEKIIDYAKKYSKNYQYATSPWSRFKIFGGGLLSKVPVELGAM